MIAIKAQRHKHTTFFVKMNHAVCVFCLVARLHSIINEHFALIKTVSKHARACTFYSLKLRSLKASALFFATQVLHVFPALENKALFSPRLASLCTIAC